MDQYLITNINELTDKVLKQKLIDYLKRVKSKISLDNVKEIRQSMTIGTNFIDLQKLI